VENSKKYNGSIDLYGRGTGITFGVMHYRYVRVKKNFFHNVGVIGITKTAEFYVDFTNISLP
jgi:hypothetical protein